MIYQTWNKGRREVMSSTPLHALVFCLYYCTKVSRQAGQMIYLKPAASTSDSRKLIVITHSHRRTSDSRGANLLIEEICVMSEHQERSSRKRKMRICKQRMYPRRQGRHHIAEQGRDRRRVFDLHTKTALTPAKNDDRSLHKLAYQNIALTDMGRPVQCKLQ
jgi:hypothetical protein